MNRNDKRAAICRLAFLPIGQATVRNKPGSPSIQVRQELEAVVTDTNADNLTAYRNLLADYGLVLVTLTNGDQRVIGTDEFPVLVSTELGGSPQALTLSVKRDSPEPAKVYSSF